MSKQSSCKKKDCVVCGRSLCSYKCPRCFMFYCSKDCCATHKETCSATNIAVSNNTLSSSGTIADTVAHAKNVIRHDSPLSLLEKDSLVPIADNRQGSNEKESMDNGSPSESQHPHANDGNKLRLLQASHESKHKEMAENDPDFLVHLQQDIFLLSDEDKRRLREHQQLQVLLRSKRLRKDLEVVDTAADRKAALRTMREKNKEFNEVVELLCDIVKKS